MLLDFFYKPRPSCQWELWRGLGVGRGQQFEETIIKPLVDGKDFGGVTHQVTNHEAPIARGVLLYMHTLALEATQPQPVAPVQPPSGASAPQAASSPSTSGKGNKDASSRSVG